MTDTKAIALESFRLIETGDAELAQHIIAPDFINQEAEDDPEDVERQQHGPAGFLATSRWLRDAFSNLRFELQETLAEGGTVMAAAVMTGQHTGLFNGIVPTGRPITHKQVHIFTITHGQITRHRAVRDDLGLLLQLGWRPRQPRIAKLQLTAFLRFTAF
jgi:predicted ester cyclase